MTDRHVVRDWLVTGLLTALTWVFAWSGGVLVTLGRSLYAPYVALETQLAPVEAQADASDAFLAALDSVVTRIVARRDSIDRFIPDSILTRKVAARYDSLATILDAAERPALRDSIDIAALHVLPLPPSDLYLVTAAEDMLGAEIGHWRQLELLSRARISGIETTGQRQSATAALDRHDIRIGSFAAAFARAERVSKRRASDVNYLRKQRDNALSDARWLLLIALLAFPVSVVGLLALYRLAVGHKWRLPFSFEPPAA